MTSSNNHQTLRSKQQATNNEASINNQQASSITSSNENNQQATTQQLVYMIYALGTWCRAPVTCPRYTEPGPHGTHTSGSSGPCSNLTWRCPNKVKPMCKTLAPPSWWVGSLQKSPPPPVLSPSPPAFNTDSSAQVRNHSSNEASRK